MTQPVYIDAALEEQLVLSILATLIELPRWAME